MRKVTPWAAGRGWAWPITCSAHAHMQVGHLWWSSVTPLPAPGDTGYMLPGPRQLSEAWQSNVRLLQMVSSNSVSHKDKKAAETVRPCLNQSASGSCPREAACICLSPQSPTTAAVLAGVKYTLERHQLLKELQEVAEGAGVFP